MEIPIKIHRALSSAFDSVFVGHANFYQFSEGQKVHHPRVESRMFLWVQQGLGAVTVNGRRSDLRPGDFLLMPWAHEIAYEADERDPLFVGSIHLIPRQSRVEKTFFWVAHNPEDALARRKSRQDFPPGEFPDQLQGTMTEGRLLWLASYIIDFFQHVGPDEPTMRALGRALAQEILLTAQAGRATQQNLPAEMQRITEYVRRHPAAPLDLQHLASFGQYSVATLHRQFRHFVGVSPHRFIAGVRVDQAKQLLRATRLPVAEVGRQVGFDDPFHFSRFFKSKTGLAPLAYRQRASIF